MCIQNLTTQFVVAPPLRGSCVFLETGTCSSEKQLLYHLLKYNESILLLLVQCIVYGTYLQASCSWDGTVRLWDLTSSSERRAAITLKGHPDAVYDVSATPSDANLLISCGRKGALVLWDLRGPGTYSS